MSSIDKTALHQFCLASIEEQIKGIELSIATQREGSEGSSSAGDKHNTEQAMQHLELEKKHIQLATALDMKQALDKIRPDKEQKKVDLGALVKTNKGVFYFSAALGKVNFNGAEVMVLSLASPIGQVLKKLKVGDRKSFNGNEWTILEIQ